jgi:hypothetical protein
VPPIPPKKQKGKAKGRAGDPKIEIEARQTRAGGAGEVSAKPLSTRNRRRG